MDDATNTAYVGTSAGTLYAIDISEGDVPERVKWQYSSEGAITGPVVFHQGAIYFGDLASNFYRLNPRSQSPDWQFDAEAWVWAEGIPDDQKGAIYVSTPWRPHLCIGHLNRQPHLEHKNRRDR